MPSWHLTDFFEAVGEAAFGVNWSSGTRPLKQTTSRTELSEAEERAALVLEDIFLALQAETVQASILLDLRSPPPRKESKSVSSKKRTNPLNVDLNTHPIEETVSPNLYDVEVDDDDPAVCRPRVRTFADDPEATWPPTRYVINPMFWTEFWFTDIDWVRSELSVPARLVQVIPASNRELMANVSYPLLDYRPDLEYDSDQRLTGPVVVLQADRALRRMFLLDNIPSDDVISRYSSFRNRLTDEIVAAAWRWIAINCQRDEVLGNGRLVDAMNRYLTMHGIDGDANKLGDKSLEAIARNILAERASRNCSGIVLKNSRSAKPLALTAKANKPLG